MTHVTEGEIDRQSMARAGLAMNGTSFRSVCRSIQSPSIERQNSGRFRLVISAQEVTAVEMKDTGIAALLHARLDLLQ